ncbi:unnamed protein product, partial [Ectocarpus sp. 13 AM-2016]
VRKEGGRKGGGTYLFLGYVIEPEKKYTGVGPLLFCSLMPGGLIKHMITYERVRMVIRIRQSGWGTPPTAGCDRVGVRGAETFFVVVRCVLCFMLFQSLTYSGQQVTV